jgi:hypothetical protein
MAVCFRCSHPDTSICEDEVTGDEYDHHLDEPRGAGYPDGEDMFRNYAIEAREAQVQLDREWLR